MKHTHDLAAILAASLLVLTACKPQPPPAIDAGTDIAAITAAADDLQKAFISRNPLGVAAVYSKDAQLLPPGAATVRGQDAIRRHYAADLAAPDSLPPTITAVDTVASGDWGWRAGTWKIASASGKFVEIWRRTPEGWRIYRDIYNVDAASPATP